ncbi:MAG: amidase [Acetobacteraceae bacterium]|nr:amidase [Acetobacteraceae bacterium]MSP29517.1 amidase [Acetobacteraceae bacterium]
MSDDLSNLAVHELSAGLQARRFSPVDVVEACLARVAALEPKLRAFVSVYADEARLAAEAADRAIRSGHGLGPLHGIPVALKDLVDLQGRITTGGSAVWKDRLSPRTATLAKKLIGAGMIVLGKTHTVEFAYGGWGTNQHMGTPWNPWDATTHRTPGGSSSGSGVAVAARMAPCAIGTDTGGSVRMPASWCGITGLKTTIGRISTHGVLPLSHTLDTPGPMTRSVEDCAILLELLQGGDAGDPQTFSLVPSNPMAGLRRGVKGLRLARMPDAERAGMHVDVLAAYDRSLADLAAMGAEIVDMPRTTSFREAGNQVGWIISAEAYALVGDIADNNALPVDAAVRPRVRAGAAISSRQYLDTLADRARLKQAFVAGLDGIDAVLTPTSMTPAIPVADVDQSTSPAFTTRWVNFLDLCALAVPNGLSSAGLPTSLQIICRGGDEATALRIGWAWENATDWKAKAPPMLG